MRYIDEIIARLPENPPDTAEVRSQESRYRKQHWRSRWPDNGISLPRIFDEGDGDVGSVSRGEIQDMAEHVSCATDAIEFYAAIAAWGCDTSARDVSRAIRVFGQAEVGTTLFAGMKQARASHPEVVYASLLPHGANYIKFLGPAYFTKLMYFTASRSHSHDGIRPLILDSRVAGALGWNTDGWQPRQYGLYLELAEMIRSRWCPDSPLDVVEYALFNLRG